MTYYYFATRQARDNEQRELEICIQAFSHSDAWKAWNRHVEKHQAEYGWLVIGNYLHRGPHGS